MRTIALISCFSILTPLAFAQAGPAKPAFEVASVRRSAQDPQNKQGMMRGGPGTEDPGRLTYENATLRMILTMAYGVERRFQIEGPDWIDTERYDIAANVPPGATPLECNLMLQNLLVERLRMTVHHETRKFDGYVLVLGKNGPKFKESRPDAAVPVPNGFPHLAPGRASGVGVGGGNGTYLLTARGVTLSFLQQLLSAQLGAGIEDETGLTGKYDYNLGFVPKRFLDSDHDNRFPDLATAVEEQLGLKLVDNSIPQDVVVIDKASKDPIEN